MGKLIEHNTLELDIENFPNIGCANLGVLLDKQECSKLREYINNSRPLTSNIFYKSKKDFENNGRWERYSPGEGYNFLDDINLDFIEKNSNFIKLVKKVLGHDYKIMKKSVIRSVSESFIPDWLTIFLKDVGRPNLNPFIKDEYQDIQYFYCTDYHQDKTRPKSDFVTFYVYLDKVDRDYSALRLLLGSHLAGMSTYPHNLRRSNSDRDFWYYSDSNGNTLKCREVSITGQVGSISCFHGLTLHGTPINTSNNPRISIRYLISMNPKNKDSNLFTKANKLIYGPQSINVHRNDVGEDGSFLPTGSALASYE